MIDSILLIAARIVTFENQRSMTNASGFFREGSNQKSASGK